MLTPSGSQNSRPGAGLLHSRLGRKWRADGGPRGPKLLPEAAVGLNPLALVPFPLGPGGNPGGGRGGAGSGRARPIFLLPPPRDT